MCKRLVPAALAIVLMTAGGTALARTGPHNQAAGLTTLKSDYSNSPDGWQWQDGSEAGPSFTSVTVIQDGTPTPGSESLPIAGDEPVVQVTPEHPPVDRARGAIALAHLPEPSTWVLLLIGLGMIGFALRGLVAANRRLARLGAAEEA